MDLYLVGTNIKYVMDASGTRSYRSTLTNIGGFVCFRWGHGPFQNRATMHFIEACTHDMWFVGLGRCASSFASSTWLAVGVTTCLLHSASAIVPVIRAILIRSAVLEFTDRRNCSYMLNVAVNYSFEVICSCAQHMLTPHGTVLFTRVGTVFIIWTSASFAIR